MTRQGCQDRESLPANFKQSFFDLPSTRATANAAVKVSPAPVVSRTFGAKMMGCLMGSFPSSNKADPLSPSFTKTCFTPCNEEQSHKEWFNEGATVYSFIHPIPDFSRIYIYIYMHCKCYTNFN